MIETLRVVHYGFTDTFPPRTQILSVSESILPEDEDNNDDAADVMMTMTMTTLVGITVSWLKRWLKG